MKSRFSRSEGGRKFCEIKTQNIGFLFFRLSFSREPTYVLVQYKYSGLWWIQAVRNDKKENQIFLTNKEIQNGAVAKSYMTNGLIIYGEIFAHFVIY
jgi:hypothetical protein